MINYLTRDEAREIANEIVFVSIKSIDDISKFTFDSEIKEYNDFLSIAITFDENNISKTFLLIHKKSNELLAYMTLSADSIRLTKDEKEMHNLLNVPYAAVPAIKIGKLAVNRRVSASVKRKGYGSFLISVAGAFVKMMNELGVACRFLTVDADIDYDKNTPEFYLKNGFVVNLSNKSRNPQHTVSMRKDVFV